MVGSLLAERPFRVPPLTQLPKQGCLFTYAIADELSPRHQCGCCVSGPIDTGFIMDEIDNVGDIVFSQP